MSVSDCGWAGENVSYFWDIHAHTQEDSSIWRLGRHHSTRAVRLPCSESGKKREEICFLSSPILSVLVQTSCIPSTSCLLLTHTDGCFSLIQTLSHSLSLFNFPFISTSDTNFPKDLQNVIFKKRAEKKKIISARTKRSTIKMASEKELEIRICRFRSTKQISFHCMPQ